MFAWARKATGWFPDRRPASKGTVVAAADHDDGLSYRLRHWPELPGHNRTADVYRALSMMSHRPIDRMWMLAHSRLQAEQVDSLLQRLIDDDAVEVIDGSRS